MEYRYNQEVSPDTVFEWTLYHDKGGVKERSYMVKEGNVFMKDEYTFGVGSGVRYLGTVAEFTTYNRSDPLNADEFKRYLYSIGYTD